MLTKDLMDLSLGQSLEGLSDGNVGIAKMIWMLMGCAALFCPWSNAIADVQFMAIIYSVHTLMLVTL